MNVEAIHAINDRETLRTSALRTVTEQHDLLVLALHAVHYGRKDVAVEYIERAMSALAQEANRLRVVQS